MHILCQNIKAAPAGAVIRDWVALLPFAVDKQVKIIPGADIRAEISATAWDGLLLWLQHAGVAACGWLSGLVDMG